MNSSDLLRFLRARSSVREYSGGEPLDPEDIDYILACASTAPSAGNREAWDVVIVTDDDVRLELASAALEQVHIREAPAVFVVCANYVRSMSHYGERGILYALEDATIACTYMMLAAHARDLHSCWTGGVRGERGSRSSRPSAAYPPPRRASRGREGGGRRSNLWSGCRWTSTCTARPGRIKHSRRE
ncbi:nitroreductase family protein [Methanoculleus chikugoensis]|uniref:nitroreductase family protein n=1 Tax=Methanoculleus chikugoensis TaxID=118126 RepID=UPI000ABC8D86|nr:nitroreductase family protein [Methanoculleus chikugoensis]